MADRRDEAAYAMTLAAIAATLGGWVAIALADETPPRPPEHRATVELAPMPTLARGPRAPAPIATTRSSR